MAIDIISDLEEAIIKNYGTLKVTFFPTNCVYDDYWRYECSCRIKLSPEVEIGSLLCYSFSKKSRLEACIALYEAIQKDKESEQKMIKKYEQMQKGGVNNG